MSRLRRLARRVRQHPMADPVVEVVDEVREDRLTGLAAEMAFFAFLSLFPLLLLLVASLGLAEQVVGDDLAGRAEDAIVEALETALGDEAGTLTDAVEALFGGPSPGLLSVGLVLTIWTASRAFAATANALDLVYDLKERRPWLRLRLLGLALTAGTVLTVTLLLGLVLVGPLLGTGRDLAERFDLGELFVTAWRWLRVPFVGAVLVAWATTMYHLAPHHRTRWRDDLPGAVVAAAGWAAVTVGFRIYLDVATDDVVVGAVGSVLTGLLWLYAMSFVLLLGAEVNAVALARAGRPAAQPPAGEPSQDGGDQSG